MNTFETLNGINVIGNTDKKGKFTYLSWAWAWAELMKAYPQATSKVYHDENTNMPYFASAAGVMVKVGVTIEGLEHINYLPVMDFKNQAKKSNAFDMMDVNKAIQRCTVKAIALHGLGLYIYAGEDLPDLPIVLPNADIKNVHAAMKGGFTLEQLKSKYQVSSELEEIFNKGLK